MFVAASLAVTVPIFSRHWDEPPQPSPGTSGITNTSSARPLSPPPLSALYPQNRQLTLRLRVFFDWVSRIFGEARL